MPNIDLSSILIRVNLMIDALQAKRWAIYETRAMNNRDIMQELDTVSGDLVIIGRELTILSSTLSIEENSLLDNSLDAETRSITERRHAETIRKANNMAKRADKTLIKAQSVLDRANAWTPELQSSHVDVERPSTPESKPLPTPKRPPIAPATQPKTTPVLKTGDSIIKGVYDGTITKHKLPEQYYKGVRGDLTDAVKKGMGNAKGFEALMEDLGYNVQAFAGAKTYNLVRDLERIKGDKDYETKAQALVKQYDTWGEAEINTAQQQTHQAKQWAIIKEDAGLFKLLKYSTIGDACKICRPLDGIVAPVNSPIWRRIYPCNHYNCYCIVIQLTEDDAQATDAKELTKLVDGSVELMNPVFLSNPGITKQVYTSKHPYFSSVPKSDRDFARENFGLPIK